MDPAKSASRAFPLASGGAINTTATGPPYKHKKTDAMRTSVKLQAQGVMRLVENFFWLKKTPQFDCGIFIAIGSVHHVFHHLRAKVTANGALCRLA